MIGVAQALAKGRVVDVHSAALNRSLVFVPDGAIPPERGPGIWLARELRIVGAERWPVAWLREVQGVKSVLGGGEVVTKESLDSFEQIMAVSDRLLPAR